MNKPMLATFKFNSWKCSHRANETYCNSKPPQLPEHYTKGNLPMNYKYNPWIGTRDRQPAKTPQGKWRTEEWVCRRNSWECNSKLGFWVFQLNRSRAGSSTRSCSSSTWKFGTFLIGPSRYIVEKWIRDYGKQNNSRGLQADAADTLLTNAHNQTKPLSILFWMSANKCKIP